MFGMLGSFIPRGNGMSQGEGDPDAFGYLNPGGGINPLGPGQRNNMEIVRKMHHPGFSMDTNYGQRSPWDD